MLRMKEKTGLAIQILIEGKDHDSIIRKVNTFITITNIYFSILILPLNMLFTSSRVVAVCDYFLQQPHPLKGCSNNPFFLMIICNIVSARCPFGYWLFIIIHDQVFTSRFTEKQDFRPLWRGGIRECCHKTRKLVNIFTKMAVQWHSGPGRPIKVKIHCGPN